MSGYVKSRKRSAKRKSAKRKSAKRKSAKRKSKSVKSRKRSAKAKKSGSSQKKMTNLIRKANAVINGPRLSARSSARKTAMAVLKQLEKHPKSKAAWFFVAEIDHLLKKEK